MDYPETRTVTWIESDDGTIVGQCEYIRKDIHETAQAEIDRLKSMLGRYAVHVEEYEGTDFLSHQPYPTDANLTDAEMAFIRQCKENGGR